MQAIYSLKCDVTHTYHRQTLYDMYFESCMSGRSDAELGSSRSFFGRNICYMKHSQVLNLQWHTIQTEYNIYFHKWSASAKWCEVFLGRGRAACVRASCMLRIVAQTSNTRTSHSAAEVAVRALARQHDSRNARVTLLNLGTNSSALSSNRCRAICLAQYVFQSSNTCISK